MKQEKQLLLDELTGMMEEHHSFVIAQYSRISVNRTIQFRKKIKSHGGDVQVAGKRLIVKAAEQLGITLDLAGLPGHIAVILGGKDPLQTTKEVFGFCKESAKAMNVLGGYLYGSLLSAEDVEQLSQLPNLEGMRSQLLGTLIAPLSQTLAIFDSVLGGVVYCLESHASAQSQE